MKNVDEIIKRMYGAQTSLAQSLTDMEGSMVNAVIIGSLPGFPLLFLVII